MNVSKPSAWVVGYVFALSVLLAACDDFDPPQKPADGQAPAADGGGGAAPMDDTAEPQPELDGGTPQPPSGGLELTRAHAGRGLIFAPIPEAGRVAVIDPAGGSVRHVAAGHRPTLLSTASDADVALCADAASTRATVIAVEAGEVRTAQVELGAGYNALAVSATGKYGVAYFSESQHDPFAGPGPGSQLSVIDLDPAEPRAARVSVGVGLREVRFSAAEGRLWAIGEAGVSSVDVSQVLAAQRALAAPQDFGPDFTIEDLELRLSTHLDRVYGFEPGGSSLLELSLQDGAVRSVALGTLLGQDMDAGGEPAITDVALARQGEVVLLAVPELEGLWVLDTATLALVDRIELGDGALERLAPFDDGSAVLVWSDDPTTRHAWLVSLDGGAPVRRVLLAGAAQAVHVGAAALVLTHGDTAAAGPGYTVLDAGGFVRFQATAEPVTQLAIGQRGAPLYVGVAGEMGADQLHAIDPGSLTLDAFELPGAPLAVGHVPDAELGFAEVQHPDGRLTLFDWDTGAALTLTGYRIVDRVKP